MARSKRNDGGFLKIGLLATVVAIVSGVVALVFVLKPTPKPCSGGARATFTRARVVPHMRYREYLIRQGERKEDAAKEQDHRGAEIHYSYRADNLRGSQLPLVWSLFTIKTDGTLGPVVPTEDRALATAVTPDACSESGGQDLFVRTPSRGRYRVQLELYRNAEHNDRLALRGALTLRGDAARRGSDRVIVTTKTPRRSLMRLTPTAP
jgi:hypothetical protein